MLFIFAVVDIAVTWHRRVILDQAIPPIGSNVRTTAFWRYFWKLFVLVGIVGGPLAIFLIVAEWDDDSAQSAPFKLDLDELLAASAAALILLTALAIFSRLSFVLPSSATKEMSLTFKQSWRFARGNTWRLTIGLFVCAILPELPVQILLSSLNLVDSRISAAEMLASKVVPHSMINGAVGRQIEIIYDLLTLPIGVGLLSHYYQQLALERPPES